MSTHPNAMLFCILTPDDLARKTYRAILADAGSEEDEGTGTVEIDGLNFTVRVMEEDYDKGYQISAKEGQIVLHNYLTYGYGERMSWSRVQEIKEALEQWAVAACEKHKCSYEISIGANYW